MPKEASETSSVRLVETPASYISTIASSTVLLTKFLMSLRSDSSSTDTMPHDSVSTTYDLD